MSIIEELRKVNTLRKIRVVDVGCGDGYWLNKISNIKDVEIIGVDSNPLRVERAKTLLPNIKIFNQDFFDFDIQTEKFDVILLSQVIEHVVDDVVFLSKIKSYLSPNGVLILGTPNEGFHLVQKEYKRRNIFATTDHVHFYKEKDIRSKIKSAGFLISDVYREPFYVGDEQLFYKFTGNKLGFWLLKMLTKILPFGCSGFYFKCKSN